MAWPPVIRHIEYLITPFIAWFVAGVAKFLINSIKTKRLAFDLMGYGGLPSTHSTIVSSMVTLIALKAGIDHPAFGVALTLAFIVILDASSLRRHIGQHASLLNKLATPHHYPPVRERIGHTPIEIAAGIALGISVASVLTYIL